MAESTSHTKSMAALESAGAQAPHSLLAEQFLLNVLVGYARAIMTRRGRIRSRSIRGRRRSIAPCDARAESGRLGPSINRNRNGARQESKRAHCRTPQAPGGPAHMVAVGVLRGAVRCCDDRKPSKEKHDGKRRIRFIHDMIPLFLLFDWHDYDYCAGPGLAFGVND